MNEKREFDELVQELMTEEGSKKWSGKVKKRRLGKTGLMVSAVGLGGHTWNVNGSGGSLDSEEARAEKTALIKKAR